MTEPKRKQHKEPKYKKVIYLNGKLSCGRCDREWTVRDLNPERKAVKCPVCGEYNDIKEAVKRAA